MGESTRARLQLDPYRPVCTFWSICAPKERDVALMTKHVLLCETATGILRQVKLAFVKLAPGTAGAVLAHLEAILVATEEASKLLSRVMARSEAAFDGVPLDLGKKYDGPTEPHACWEEQLRVLCRMLDPSVHPAPVLNAMLHGKVLELLGRDVAGDGEARDRGQRVWLNDRDPASMRTKAHVVHRVVTEFITRWRISQRMRPRRLPPRGSSDRREAAARLAAQLAARLAALACCPSCTAPHGFRSAGCIPTRLDFRGRFSVAASLDRAIWLLGWSFSGGGSGAREP